MSSYNRAFSSMSVGGSRARGGLASGYSGVRAAGAGLPEPAGCWPGIPVWNPRGEREEMQELNKRLSGYLLRVKELEATNSSMEADIKELLSARGAIVKDHGDHFAAIAELRSKMLAQVMENGRLGLDVENARLAADDFRCKWESEEALRGSVEADIDKLRSLLGALAVSREALAAETQLLRRELADMKRSHAEEAAALQVRAEEGCRVTVAVGGSRGPELPRVLGAARDQYEALIASRRGQADHAFRKQLESVKVQRGDEEQAACAAKAELAEVRRHMQGLTVEFESLLALLGSLEGQLWQAERGGTRELAALGERGDALHGALLAVRDATNTQLADYTALLNTKMKLEQEIATYRRLLDGEDSPPVIVIQPEAAKEEVKKRKKVVITQTIVDGEVVDTSEEVSESSEKA